MIVLQLLTVPVLTYDGQDYTNSFLSLIGCELRSAPKSPDIYIKGDFRDHFLSKSIFIVEGYSLSGLPSELHR